MIGDEKRSRVRGLMATQARRTAVLTVALLLTLAFQLLSLLDVFEGASTAVWMAVLAAQCLLLLVIIGGLVATLREARTRRRP